MPYQMIADVRKILLNTVKSQPPPQEQPPSRKLQSHEFEKVKQQLHPSSWDEGVLLEFQSRPTVQGYAVDLTGGGILLFFSETYEPQIAKEVDTLLRWLGTPKGFTVNLWWRDDPRRIKADEWPSKTTVNGGWTYPNSDFIVVYRREEWDRVLIHETIHAMGWDWHMPEKPLNCWNFKENDTLQPALFEAWTELYAEWLWCSWHSVPWETQCQWQEYQALQILSRETSSWKENTNVFAYYILKAALSPHIAFLLCFGNGETNEERMSVLCGLVTPRLDELREKAKRIKPVTLSLRMTVKK